MKQLHSIPIGGDEPEHESRESCWCLPFKNSINFYQHHAKDCREKLERQNIFKPGNKWVLIEVNSGHKHSECFCYGAKPGHNVGDEGCYYEMVPDPIPAPPHENGYDMWDTQIGGIITDFSLKQQRGYTRLKCGCWIAWKESCNSLDTI